MDLAYLIRRAARSYPDAPAVSDRRGIATLAAVVDRAERMANALDMLGVPAGAAVGVLSENRVEYPEVDLALALGRRVRVALNCKLHRDDFRFALQDSGARALVHSGSFAEDAEALAAELGLVAIDLDGEGERGYPRLLADAPATPVVRALDVEQPAWISYTSGTTGRPKGVVLSHRAVREVAFNLLLELGPQRTGARLVLTQPLSHGAGYFVLPWLFAGGGVHVIDGFVADEVLWAAEQPGVDALKAVPAMFPTLLEAHAAAGGRPLGYDKIVYGASPMPGPILDEALERFGPVLIQIYGQSEAPVTITCMRQEDHARTGAHRGSAGRPWSSVAVEVRAPDGAPVGVGETGEVVVRGTHHMTGYHGLPEATAEVLRDGWVWTKDMGTIDEQGFVHLLGRRDEMINSGGFNISPREVEHVLQDHPAVAECVVIGTPDPRWGTAVNAVVRLRADAGVTGEEIIAFARPRLTFRTPKRVFVADGIPKNPYGKVDRARVLLALEGADAGGNGDGNGR
ncbi:MAG TPA: AMP-binding protein [Conexibacter sp.]|jgi:fatty-acyl-CoA synthase